MAPGRPARWRGAARPARRPSRSCCSCSCPPPPPPRTPCSCRATRPTARGSRPRPPRCGSPSTRRSRCRPARPRGLAVDRPGSRVDLPARAADGGRAVVVPLRARRAAPASTGSPGGSSRRTATSSPGRSASGSGGTRTRWAGGRRPARRSTAATATATGLGYLGLALGIGRARRGRALLAVAAAPPPGAADRGRRAGRCRRRPPSADLLLRGPARRRLGLAGRAAARGPRLHAERARRAPCSSRASPCWWSSPCCCCAGPSGGSSPSPRSRSASRCSPPSRCSGTRRRARWRCCCPPPSLHLAAMALWLGGLVVLLTSVLPRFRATPAAGLRAVRRWSVVAFAAVAVLVVTGEVQAFPTVAPLDALWSTDYGGLLLVKLALVAARARARRRAAAGRRARRRGPPARGCGASVAREVGGRGAVSSASPRRSAARRPRPRPTGRP